MKVQFSWNQSDTGVINIIYAGGDTPTLRGILESGSVLNGVVNDVALTGVLNIPPSTFSSYGTYKMMLVLDNYLGNLTEEAVIHYEQSISGFQISFNEPFAPLNESVMINYSCTSGSNINYNMMFNGTTVEFIEIEGVVLSVGRNWTFVSAGIYNVTVEAANNISKEMDSLEIVARLRIPVSGFNVSDDQVLLNNGETVSVDFTYEAGDYPVLKGYLDFGTIIDGSVNQETRTGVFSVGSSLFSSHAFGIYNLLLELGNQAGNETKKLVVYYEEKIEGLQLDFEYSFAPLNETVTFTYTMTKGSNIRLYWRQNDTDITFQDLEGLVRSGSLNVTFYEYAVLNISIEARNNISSSVTSLMVTAREREISVPVSGFKINNDSSGPVNLEPGTLKVVNYTFDAGDNPVLKVVITDVATISGTLDLTLREGTVIIDSSMFSSKPYGTYFLVLELSNKANSMRHQVPIYYEEAIEGFQATFLHPYAPINEDVVFSYTFTKGSNIRITWLRDNFTMDTLDKNGTVRSGRHNLTFDTPGIYNMTIEARNTLSYSVINLILTARYRIPVYNFTLQPHKDVLHYDSYFVPIHENVVIYFTNAEGSNMNVEWAHEKGITTQFYEGKTIYVPVGDFTLIPAEITVMNMREGENRTLIFTFVTETGTPPILLAQLDYGTTNTGCFSR
ncbi:hypothetical protein KUTeg_003085 [Tegillarca granosa]|uniref:Uncharacterized protein n=1 Tax=Tegillarca granosa TaxID=220873 RepID=A0ABQ9FL42_TEGGR|nr:hypothetical protein KUTeg_003085 [Tegillarca granosa]